MGSYDYLIIGAGFSGAVLARKLAENNFKVLVVDKRNHIAGNCYTERHECGVMVHKYGPHIFNTNEKDIWEYVNNFGVFVPFKNKVIANTEKGIFNLPINLHTINQFFNQKLTPSNVESFLKNQTTQKEIYNFEDQALNFVGEEIYKNFFYGYTKKQWGCEPKDLPASILKRIPIRFNYDDNYYNSIYQGIPLNGFTEIIANILNHENIDIKLNFEYHKDMNSNFKHVFYSGPIDAYYDYLYGRLGYRTVVFEENVYEGDYQGNAVINYCEEHIKQTRVHEHKHFTPWEKHQKTIVLTEYSKETLENDDPFYPKRLKDDMIIFQKYKELSITNIENVSFIGRLATYRYLDMDKVIKEAIDYASYFLLNKDKKELIKFSDNI
jgi:UDP-galactopyranose mutase